MLNPRCEVCGRFCRPVDSGNVYGTCRDFEPPDPSFFCQSCYDRELDTAKKHPEKVIVGCWWIKPSFVAVAKSVMRHRRKEATA
jgi:hypothetical protein